MTSLADRSGLRLALPDTRQRTDGAEISDAWAVLADCSPESAFVVEDPCLSNTGRLGNCVRERQGRRPLWISRRVAGDSAREKGHPVQERAAAVASASDRAPRSGPVGLDVPTRRAGVKERDAPSRTYADVSSSGTAPLRAAADSGPFWHLPV